MANPEHVRVLRAGRDAVEAFQKIHDSPALDLSGSDLSGFNFDGFNLGMARLDECTLRECSFKSTNLTAAIMVETDLSRARFQASSMAGTALVSARCSHTNFYYCTFWMTLLLKADLDHTTFRGCTFHYADLSETDWRTVHLDSSIFAGINFSQCAHLDEVQHIQGSSLDIATILKSGTNIPRSFLLGCGVPQDFITQIPALVGMLQPIQFYSCFISYSSREDEFARRLHGRMEQEKLRVWFAPEDMKGGDKMFSQIEEAIRVHDKLLLVLSEASMASEWVKTEIRRARAREVREKRQVLFPIRLVGIDAIKAWSAFDSDTGKDMAVEVREYHIPDFSNWKDHDSFEEAFKRLLRDLKKSAEPMSSI